MEETKNLTLMFVDLVGYTKKTSKSTRAKFIELISNYKNLVEPIFSQFKGHIVKEIGDAFMVSFESPTNSVLCGVYIQNAIIEYNKSRPKDEKIITKIAINSGEVHITEKDVYGDPVNVASRIEKITPAGRIYFTESVFLSMNKNEVSIGFVGEKRFKGVPHKVRIYTVLGKYDKVIYKIKKKKKELKKSLRDIIITIMIILFLIVAAIGIAVTIYPEILTYVNF